MIPNTSERLSLITISKNMTTTNNEIHCILCGNDSKLHHNAYPGYQIPTVFEIHYCPSCNTSFSLPRDTATKIYDLIYKNGSEVRWYDRYFRNAELVKTENQPLNYLAESEETYWAVKESLKQITKNDNISPKILEIGCGLGYLTYSLNKAGYNAQGLDISLEAINLALKNYGNYYICADLYEYAKTYKNEYDIIIFTEVIEHLNDIISFMESLRYLLKSEGKIILTTPNKSFYPTDVIWATDLPPVHCWWLSEDSVRYIANKINMNVYFLNFEKYYSNHITWVDLRDISIPITPPVFDINGILINPTLKKNRKEVKIVLKKIRLFKLIYLKIINFLNSNNRNIIIPHNRGPVLCAILQVQID